MSKNSVKKEKNTTRYEETDYMDEMQEGERPMMMEERKHMMLAHSYVPWQHYTKAFNPQEALRKGTLFPELYGPYPPPE